MRQSSSRFGIFGIYSGPDYMKDPYNLPRPDLLVTKHTGQSDATLKRKEEGRLLATHQTTYGTKR